MYDRCLHGTSPSYLVNSCTPTADIAGRQHLRSASQRKLLGPLVPVADQPGRRTLCSGDGTICQTFNSRWPGVHCCWTLCLEHSARCCQQRKTWLFRKSYPDIIIWTSIPQTINLAVAVLLRQIPDWLIYWLIVPRYRLNSFGRRCFAVAGPSTWNSLPDSLRDPALSLNMFRHQLKTQFFVKYWRDVLSSLEIVW